MILLSSHFSEEEFSIGLDTEERIKSNARFLCVEILEPIRNYFQEPLIITSGYRPPEVNTHAHGVENSYHLYENGRSAADFKTKIAPLNEVFDWIRITSGIKYDKIILEFDLSKNMKCIHTQLCITETPRKQAFIGHTGNLGGHKYKQVTSLQTIAEGLALLIKEGPE